VLPAFAILGVVDLVMVAAAASLMRNPPGGWKPAGWEPSEAQKAQRSARDYSVKEAVRTWQWYALWTLLFLNLTAGIAIISQAAGMAREISGASVIAAAGLVGIISMPAFAADYFGPKNVGSVYGLMLTA
jgi:MFS transporter, OFA family, oxalate/formate antiporter